MRLPRISNFTDVESAGCVLQDFPVSQGGKPRVLADISIGCKGTNTGIVLCLLIRKDGDPRKWTVKVVGETHPWRRGGRPWPRHGRPPPWRRE